MIGAKTEYELKSVFVGSDNVCIDCRSDMALIFPKDSPGYSEYENILSVRIYEEDDKGFLTSVRYTRRKTGVFYDYYLEGKSKMYTNILYPSKLRIVDPNAFVWEKI